jgi:CheY-like chemotaxis protein
MPVMDGIAATRKLTRLAARAGVLILTTYDRGSRCEQSRSNAAIDGAATRAITIPRRPSCPARRGTRGRHVSYIGARLVRW